MTSELELERLGLVPADVRDFVLERDGQCCRLCGRFADQPALHHVVFRSQGGLDVPSNLVTIGWVPWHDCHLKFAHGPEAALWRPILLDLAAGREFGTALAVRRQRER
jgi:5-methylcytosine-specific restriction endonuclease McrA